MITDSFLNSCLSLVLCREPKMKKSKALYRDIIEILETYEGRETVEIPLIVKNKVDCLKEICKLFLDDKSVETVLDSISFSEKFKQFRDLLDLKANEKLTNIAVNDMIKQVKLRKKVNALFKNYDELSKVLDTIKDGTFDSIDNLIEDYEITIKSLYANMTEANRSVMIESTASLDLVKDNYNHVVEVIKMKYDRESKTPTGFSILDGVMNGGFEPSRLYLFGGGSGAGKSTMINNLIIKSAETGRGFLSRNDKQKVYVYITLENTIEESLMRTYQPMFSKDVVQMLQDISSGINIKEKIVSELNKSNVTVIMKYFPPMTISVVDIMGVLDEVIEEYGEGSICGVFIDYLDLLRTDTKYDLYRLELGHITLSLKTLAVQYTIPVITATQLGRSAYRVRDSRDLNLDQMSESIKKVEHADFVCLLALDEFDKHLVHSKVGKNRSGVSNVSIDFKVDFDKFKFVSGTRAANVDKPDATSKSQMFSFEGMRSS